MVDDAPRHPGCPISRELDYGITDEWDGLVEAIEEIAPTTIEGAVIGREEAGWPMRPGDFSIDIATIHFQDMFWPNVTTVVEQRALISGLQAADHQRQVQLTMALKLLKGLQTQMAEFQGQQGPAEGPAQPDAPEEAARDTTRNGDDSHSSGVGIRRPVQVLVNGTYPDFLTANPLNFKGHEGVVGLTRWFEKDEFCVHISTCTIAVKSNLRLDLWQDMLLHGEMPILDVARNVFGRVRPNRRYIGGLPDMILGSVKASKSKTMQEVIEFTTELMEDKTKAYVERLADNKRKAEDSARNNQIQQANKRQNTGRAYAAGNVDRGTYTKDLDLGVLSVTITTTVLVLQNATSATDLGHIKRDCPKLKNNNNRGNRDGNAKAPTKVYAVGNTGANPDNNVVTGTFLLNNRYASILFDTGADRSFVSTTFSSSKCYHPTALIMITMSKLADGRMWG
ncbi:putative reverse transcriptase domain-containing protein [Tanacetum coccineum]